MDEQIHLVAFLDILGFKQMVDNHFSGKDSKSIDILKSALKEAEQRAIIQNQYFYKQYKVEVSFKQFSDCVSISMPFIIEGEHTPLTVFGAFINVIRVYHSILLDQKILIRGGISFGKHIENSNMIFSEGLVNAYKLETEKAIYPRIVIDNKIINILNDFLSKNPEVHTQFFDIYGSSIIKDWDDTVFVSPFGFFKEMKTYEKHFGEGILKSLLIQYNLANGLKGDMSDEEMEERLKTMDDEEVISPIISFVEEYLNINKDRVKTDVKLKYKWLLQFMKWSLNPEDSKIIFKCYFEKP